MKVATQRINAGFTDYIFIGIIAFIVVGLAGLATRSLGFTTVDIGSVDTSVPTRFFISIIVVVYFTMSEIGGGTTMNKEIYGLTVVGTRPRIVVRNLIKFSPVLISVFIPSASDAAPIIMKFAFFMPFLMFCLFVISIMISPNRAIYDRIAGTRVERFRVIPKPPYNLNTN